MPLPCIEAARGRIVEESEVSYLLSPAPGLLFCFLAPSSAFPLLSCCLPAAVPFIVVADMLAPSESVVGLVGGRRGNVYGAEVGGETRKSQQQQSVVQHGGPLGWRAHGDPHARSTPRSLASGCKEGGGEKRGANSGRQCPRHVGVGRGRVVVREEGVSEGR